MELHIPQEVLDKVMFWVNHKDMEVSGFGKISYDKKAKVFTVVDAFLLEQEGGSAHTDIDDKSLAKLLYTSRAVEGELAWWWHSHVKMEVFWSQTDRDTIKDLGKQGWIVASVFNQREEIRSALCYQTTAKVESEFGSEDVVSTNMVDDLKTFILNAPGEDPRHKVWAADYEAHVKEKKYEVWKPSDERRIQLGDHSLTGKEWDEYTSSKFNTVQDWRKSREKSLIQTTDNYICEECGYMSTYCMCDDEGEGDTVDLSDKRFENSDMPFSIHDPGLLGYGIDMEAAALNLKPYAYLAILNDTSDTRASKNLIRKLEDRLDDAVRKGTLV